MTTIGFAASRIPIEPEITDEDREYVNLRRTVNLPGGAGTEKRSSRLPYLTDGDDIESVLRLIDEFEDACDATRLDLSTGTLRKNYFRQCLGDTARNDWDTHAAAVGNTVANSRTARDNFIEEYVLPTDLADQIRYMTAYTKPMNVSVSKLFSRYRFLNQLMTWMPGAAGFPFDDQRLKEILFSTMPETWCNNFIVAGQDIMNNAYTLDQLKRFMMVQEKSSASKYQKSQAQRNQVPKKRGRDSSSERNSYKGNKRQKTSSDGKNCPMHPGMHAWHDCFGNPHGPNYRPNYRFCF